jgi:hypothetical protein
LEKKPRSNAKNSVYTIHEDGKTIGSFSSLYEFRLFIFGHDGHTDSLGKLPRVAIEHGLPEFAAEWAAGVTRESMNEVESIFREQYPSCRLLSLLQLLDQDEARCLLEDYFQEQCGPEDGPIACKIICELLSALRRRLEREGQTASPLAPANLLPGDATAAVVDVLTAMFRTEPNQEVR